MVCLTLYYIRFKDSRWTRKTHSIPEPEKAAEFQAVEIQADLTTSSIWSKTAVDRKWTDNEAYIQHLAQNSLP